MGLFQSHEWAGIHNADGFSRMFFENESFFVRDSRSRNVSKRRLGKRMDAYQLKDLDRVTFVDHISKTG